MNNIPRLTARQTRCLLSAAVVGGASLAGLLGSSGSALASTPHGWAVVESCASVAGKVTYKTGLLNSKPRVTNGKLQATISSCGDVYNGPVGGTGALSAALTGTAKVGAENFTGTFTIDWPASTGLNPSSGSIIVTESAGVESVYGTISAGAFTTAPIQLAYQNVANTGKGTVKHPITAQRFINTQQLAVKENFG
jgi:hypothetical protein